MFKNVSFKKKKNYNIPSHEVYIKILKIKILYIARSICSKPIYESRINHRINVDNIYF